MTARPLRAFPGLWIGRRAVLQASRRQPALGEAAFICGGCHDVVVAEAPAPQLSEVVLRCDCGEYNQA